MCDCNKIVEGTKEMWVVAYVVELYSKHGNSTEARVEGIYFDVDEVENAVNRLYEANGILDVEWRKFLI